MQADIRRIALFLLPFVLPAAASAADAQSILETAQQKQLERWEGVNVYVVEQSIMGHAAETYFQRFEVVGDDGTQTLFMPVAPGDLPDLDCSAARQMTPEELDAFASGLEMGGAGIAEGMEQGLEDAGLPRGMLAASGSDPNASFDPRVMMGGGAAMMRSMADYERTRAADPDRAARDAAESADHMAEFLRRARLVGTEPVDGRKAYHLEATGIDHVQAMDDGEYRLHTIGMWMDAEHFVPLRMKMDGELTQGKETRPMTIEQLSSDYRQVPGSKLFEPYQRKMKISGVMDAAQQAELQRAQAQMADLEKQMAGMPAGQRAMMERMMGPQLEMIRNMASGGGFQTEVTVNAITVNPKTCAGGGRG